MKPSQRLLVNNVFALTLVSSLAACGSEPSRPLEKPKGTVASAAGSDAEASVLSPDQLTKSIELEKSMITKRSALLELERDRSGKLRRELLSDSAKGCQANTKMAKLEVRVKGSWLDRLALSESVTPQTPVGSPETVTIRLGDSIAITNDERSTSIFQPAGKIISAEFTDYKIGDIEFIKIKKGGVGIQSERTCKTILGVEACTYQNFETNRYELNSIELLVNDQLLYKKDGINKILEKVSLEWNEFDLAANEAWLKLMAREDCSQQTTPKGGQ